MKEGIINVFKELIATPNGQLRIIGAIMCIGPAYFSYITEREIINFDYMLLGTGALFVVISAIMAVIKGRSNDETHK